MSDQGCNNDLYEGSDVDQIAKMKSECLYNLGQMHQYGYGVDKDVSSSIRFYKKSAQTFGHPKSFAKLADFFYSRNDKTTAMTYYRKAYELGELSALNSIGLMQESGYGEHEANPKEAMASYADAHK